MLTMSDCMTFPDDWRDFLKEYSHKDTEHVYSNGIEFIPTFRVEQLIEHLLKEQEPRVLTFEEMDSLANKREETVVYLERRWDTNIYGAIAGHCNGVLPNLSCIGTMRNVIQQYNQTWRCWSSKPTDEQREAVPWQD